MAVNDKTDLIVTSYNRTSPPVFKAGFDRYLQDELQRIETAISTLNNAAIQVLDEPPSNPLKGMVRFNKLPWDALGDNSEGLVVYNGTAWVAV